MDAFYVNLLAWLSILFILMLGFLIMALMSRRAMRQVLKIFHKTSSLCSQRPKGVEELGLNPPGFVERMFKLRDYKPYALQALIQAGIVRKDFTGRVCLLEDKVPEAFRNA